MDTKFKEDLKKAMLARDEVTVSTLRLLISELKNAAIAKGGIDTQLSEAEILAVVAKELKKRKEGALGFRQAGKEESAQKEELEAKVLEKYLPAQISDEELTKVIEEVITNLAASGVQDMGRVIGAVMGKVGQGADGARVAGIVKTCLTS